jgi:phenylalanyl-tRNA synthetase beta chain
MLISYNWLKDFFEKGVLDNVSPQEICNILNNQGIEVADSKYIGKDFENVVVAEVLEREKHPNADKLSLCKVFDGTNEYQVVCGAKNVEKGIKIAFSKIGAILPGGFKIEKAKIRGVESFGMICSEKELGLAKESEGIWILPSDAPLGEEFAKFIGFDDNIFEIEITPNRGDCLSILGIAREISAGLNLKIKMPEIKNIDESEKSDSFKTSDSFKKISVEIQNNLDCKTYSASLIKNIKNSVLTPNWIKFRLIKCGLRPINFFVDITNYILLEFGQPMHVFDYKKLESESEDSKKIIIRNAKNDEKIKALNDLEYKLNENNLVIADEKNPIAIAGVIGGLDSSVDEKTEEIVFESAVFSTSTVRKTSRSLGVSTDSSYRFERGVSFEIKNIALKRAIYLLLSVFPNAEIINFINLENKIEESRIIDLSLKKANKVLGKEYSKENIFEIFDKLNFNIKNITEENFSIQVPDYRNDITQDVDLIEEIARIDNYNNIAEKPILISPYIENQKNSKWKKVNEIKDFFVKLGFYEAVNYPFVSKQKMELFSKNESENQFFKIVNPLSEGEEFMTNNRLSRLIENAILTSKRNEESIKLFELDKVYAKNTNVGKDLENNENFVLAAAIMGNQNEIYWDDKNKGKKVDFYYIKGIFESFVKNLVFNNNPNNDSLSFKNLDSMDFDFSLKNIFDSVESVGIFLDNELIGFMGKISKKAEKIFDTKKEIFVFEINLEKVFFIMENSKQKSFSALSCFPMVERDLSLIVQNGTEYKNIEDTIKEETKSLLVDLKLVDIYEGEQIEKGSKNICVRFYLQSKNETLSDDKINFFQSKILKKLEENFNIKLRV